MTAPSAGDEGLAALAGVTRLPPAARPAALEPLLRHPAGPVREAAQRVGAALLPADCLVTYLRNGADAVLRNAGLAMLKARGAASLPVALGLLEDADADVVLQAVLILDHLRAPLALDGLRRALRHPNLNVVQAAILAIGHLGSGGAVADLTPFLAGDDWVRIAAVQALGDLRRAEAVPALVALLSDDEVGPLAAESLARIGGVDAFAGLAAHWLSAGRPRTAPGVLELLVHVAEESPDPLGAAAGPDLRLALAAVLRDPGTARLDAARALLALGPGESDSAALAALAAAAEPGAFPPCLRRRPTLIRVLLSGATGLEREWGLRLAARYPEHTPVDALAAVLGARGVEHLEPLVEAVCAATDERLGAPIASCYAGLPRGTRAAWTPVLVRHGAAIKRALQDGLELPDDTRTVLAIVAEPVADRVAAMLRGVAPAVRAEALEHLGERVEVLRLLPWSEWLADAPDLYGTIAVAAAERGALTGHLERIRRLAQDRPHHDYIRLLGRLRDRGSVPFLARVADAETPGLVPFALAALGSIGGTGARRALRRHAARPTPWARFAVRALADCHDADDLPLFRSLAEHGDWHIRMVSAAVLGRAGLSNDQPTLARLAADPAAPVSEQAQRVLR